MLIIKKKIDTRNYRHSGLDSISCVILVKIAHNFSNSLIGYYQRIAHSEFYTRYALVFNVNFIEFLRVPLIIFLCTCLEII
jgi:hypothetical protein